MVPERTYSLEEIACTVVEVVEEALAFDIEVVEDTFVPGVKDTFVPGAEDTFVPGVEDICFVK